jgi:hypothetical protein
MVNMNYDSHKVCVQVSWEEVAKRREVSIMLFWAENVTWECVAFVTVTGIHS